MWLRLSRLGCLATAAFFVTVRGVSFLQFPDDTPGASIRDAEPRIEILEDLIDGVIPQCERGFHQGREQFRHSTLQWPPSNIGVLAHSAAEGRRCALFHRVMVAVRRPCAVLLERKLPEMERDCLFY